MKNRGDIYDRLLYIAVAIFAVLLLAREFVVPSIGGVIVVGIMAILMILLPYKQCISFLFFVLPLTCGIPGFSMLCSYIIILSKSKNINSWQFIPPICIVLLELFHVCNYNFVISMPAVFSFSSFILVFFYLIFNCDRRVDIADCIKLFIIGTVFACVTVILKLTSTVGIEELMLGTLRGGVLATEEVVIGQFDLNANSMAFYSIVSFTCLLIGSKILRMPSIAHTVLLTLSVIVGLLSFSRTYIMLLALAVLLYLVSNRHSMKAIIAGLILTCVLVYVAPLFFESLLDVFTERFSDENATSAGGRTEIFMIYHNAFLDNPRLYIGGTGVVHYSNVIGYHMSMHCGFQQLYVCCGIIGLVVYFVSALHYKRRYVTKGLPATFYIPLIVCFIFSQSIQFLNPYFLMLPFIPVVYILRLKIFTYENIGINS